MKAIVLAIIRKLGLIKVADKSRYYLHFFKTKKHRRSFMNKYPNVVLPPPYFLYETFGLNYYNLLDELE